MSNLSYWIAGLSVEDPAEYPPPAFGAAFPAAFALAFADFSAIRFSVSSILLSQRFLAASARANILASVGDGAPMASRALER